MESILFADAIGDELKHLLKEKSFSRLGVICDTNTHLHCYPLIEPFLPIGHTVYTFAAGETNKTIDTCMQIWQWMTDEGFDRKALILNLGGGVAGDMGGFCAATYKRGIRFINIPTTLLAQVDASVGGKLGIDFHGYKNHIGVFTSPEMVLIAPSFLKTLPVKELRSGYAEVLKHGLIRDSAYYKRLNPTDWQQQEWKTIIAHSVSIKKEVVEEDPLETGLRKILNFGHTIGHAFETLFLGTQQHLLHGEAIAIGMICEAYLSLKKSGFQEADLTSIVQTMLTIFGKFDFDEQDIERIVALCSQDKKNVGSTLNFSLLTQIGNCTYNVPVMAEEIREAILYYRQLTPVAANPTA